MKLDMFEEIDGKNWLYDADNPETKYEVVSLLDITGEETLYEEHAIGGVVKFAEDNFQIFTFNEKISPDEIRKMIPHETIN